MIHYKFCFIKLRKSFVSYHHYIIIVMNKIPKESTLTYLEIEEFCVWLTFKLLNSVYRLSVLIQVGQNSFVIFFEGKKPGFDRFI